MGKLLAQYCPKLYFSQGGVFPAKSNFFTYNRTSQGAWRTKSKQFQYQVSWYIKTSLKLPEILYSKCAEAIISIS